MSKISIFNLIQKKLDGYDLTPKERRVGEYIVNNKKEARELNMQGLADESETSTGTVLRFAKEVLGLSGFTEMKNEIISTSEHQEKPIFEKDLESKLGIILNNVYENIKKTNEYKTKVVAEKIINSNSIIVFDPEKLGEYGISKRLYNIGLPNFYINREEDLKNIINGIPKDRNIMLISILTKEINRDYLKLVNLKENNNLNVLNIVSRNTRNNIKENEKNIVVDLNKEQAFGNIYDNTISLSVYLKLLLIEIENIKAGGN
ncbi:MAG: MurR/RpiR family transcriptional regulator [bacterium]